MAKRLCMMTWEEVKQEMSIAGNPEEITQLGKDMMQLVAKSLDETNRAQLTNIEFAIHRVLAEVKFMQRRYDKSH